MDVREFIRKWKGVTLNEIAASQEHFLDICELVGHPKPAEADPTGEWYRFERHVDKSGGGTGRADVWKKDHFAWEYKGPHKDLDAAYQQLLRYHESLGQPPLLVVSDMQHFEIHTKWQGYMPRVYEFDLESLTDPTPFHYLRSLFHDPNALHPRETADKMTLDAAERFAALADDLRGDTAPRPVAHFLTQVVFCLFAEDIGLLPRGPKGEAGIFTEIVRECQKEKYGQFSRYAEDLFRSMSTGGSLLLKDIAHFNGGLFTENGGFKIPPLGVEHLAQLEAATDLDWSAVEPSIFGTLFERGLDPSKRAQFGAHYTSKDDILAIVEPVLMWPLRREWEQIKESVGAHGGAPSTSPALRDAFLSKLAATRVLDPACGSGNFLYVSLNLLKDLEKEVILHPAFESLPPAEPKVSPAQLYGIEISEYAHELASVVVWIGHIQWHRNNGFTYKQRPILQKLDNIANTDAILDTTSDGSLPDYSNHAYWPEVDVIVGNPPFIGVRKMRAALGDDYVSALFDLYEGGPPDSTADFVTYWFARAHQHIRDGKAKRAGLLATQSIRGISNRSILESIKRDGDIFFAESDRKWTLDGAEVRVSMVGFDGGSEKVKWLDGAQVENINADLSAGVNLVGAKKLAENQGIAFQGPVKVGPFELEAQVALGMLEQPNPNRRPNADVIRPWINASDITGRSRGMYIIDFGDLSLEAASLYEAPFEHVRQFVKPDRDNNRRDKRRLNWWQHGETVPGLRAALNPLSRFIATPRVAKHRLFVWVQNEVLVDTRVIAIARDDDFFFGMLQSKVHEVWSLHLGPRHGVGNDPTYTPTTTFETFPLPWPPGQEPITDPRYAAISAAAKELNEKREAWLNPERGPLQEELSWQRTLKDRTLTKLYNAMPEWLRILHEKLDKAVFAAYGWEYPLDDEEILRRLLELNLARSA